MGDDSATVLNQRIVKIDTDRSLLYIQGNCPGCIGGQIRVRDAFKKRNKQVWDLQFPTYIAESEEAEAASRMQTFEGPTQDPWTDDYHENDVVSGVD